MSDDIIEKIKKKLIDETKNRNIIVIGATGLIGAEACNRLCRGKYCNF